jgi:hypothetical protein
MNKIYTALSLVLLLVGNNAAAAFSAVAPKSSSSPSSASKGGEMMEPVDKTMTGIDKEGSFDPTEGDNPALQRNNQDEVWVPQVRTYVCISVCMYPCM